MMQKNYRCLWVLETLRKNARQKKKVTIAFSLRTMSFQKERKAKKVGGLPDSYSARYCRFCYLCNTMLCRLTQVNFYNWD